MLAAFVKNLHRTNKGQYYDMENFHTAAATVESAESQTMEEYLRSWGLNMYIDKFKEHCIDLDTLQILSADDLKDLVPVIGHRAKLMAQIRILKNIITDAFPNHNKSITDIEDSVANNNSIYLINDNAVIDLEQLGEVQESYNIEHSQPSSIIASQEVPVHCKLYETLTSCNEGRGLLLRFQENGLLDNSGRRRLCNLIINSELKDDPDKKITSSRLYQLAYEITEIFKKESSSVYFIPFASFCPQQKISAKGKLLDCYRQRRREFIKSGIIKGKEKPCGSASSSHSGSESPRPSTSIKAAILQLQDNSDDIQDKLLWLKNCCEPWQTVEDNWKSTTKSRLNLLQSENLSIQQYYSELKPLNQPGGIFLLLKDFKTLYPENDEKLRENWLLIQSKIIAHAKTRCTDGYFKGILNDLEHAENEEVIDVAAFLALPFLMTTSNVKTKSKSKRLWRPSKHEVQEAFITHVRSSAEIEEVISRRVQKLHGFGLTMQPFIIIVGPTLKDLSNRYIIVNNIRYEITSTLNAVDACFKVIFVLNAQYPAECVHVWQFIQIALFQLKTKYDKIYTTTNTLLTDLNITQIQ